MDEIVNRSERSNIALTDERLDSLLTQTAGIT